VKRVTDIDPVRLGAEDAGEDLRLYQRLGYQETGRTPSADYHLVHLAKSRFG
jgi:hypothetical protein